MKRLNEFLRGNAGLFEKTDQCPDFQLAMIGHNTARRAAAHHDVTSALTSNHEPQMFQGMNNISP